MSAPSGLVPDSSKRKKNNNKLIALFANLELFFQLNHKIN